jgi:hypothetical protein
MIGECRIAVMGYRDAPVADQTEGPTNAQLLKFLEEARGGGIAR